MAAQLEGGPIALSGSSDVEGHRTYKVSHRVNVTADGTNFDGPQIAMDCEDLPQEGDTWAFGNDLDQWAWCTAEKTCEPVQPKQGFPIVQFIVTQTFSAKPPPANRQRCNDIRIEDPLLEPIKIRVSTTQDKEEAVYNVWGLAVTNSAHEPMRGPQMEFNRSYFKVRFEKNVPYHNLPLLSAFRDTVNMFPIWGMPPRTVLLSSIDLDRKYLGRCQEYWTLILEFEIREDTWDRDLLDEGTKALHGEFNSAGEYVLIDIDGEPPDPFNPAHFSQFKDRNGENCRVILNGRGVPAGVMVNRRRPNVYYVRLTSGAGTALDVDTVWVRLADGTFFWNPGVSYNRGNVVLFDPSADVTEATVPSDTANYYICLTDDTTSFPNVDFTNWQILDNGIADKGEFSLTTSYTIGDRVTPAVEAAGEEPAGSIFVQKYLSADFLYLGIPAIF